MEAILSQKLELANIQLTESLQANETQKRMYEKMLSALQHEDVQSVRSSQSVLVAGREAIEET